jgi:predicted nuclease with TOPRIM domain
MSFLEFAVAVVLAIAGGAAGAAIVNGINERWKFKADRKATKEDKAEEKADKTEKIEEAVRKFEESENEKNEEIDTRLKSLENQMAAQSEALKLILLDRILHLGKGYIEKGEISFDDRRRFHEMHDCYHQGLHGNGDAALVVEGVDQLPVKM